MVFKMSIVTELDLLQCWRDTQTCQQRARSACEALNTHTQADAAEEILQLI